MHRLFMATCLMSLFTCATSFAAESPVPEEDRMIMNCDVLQTAEQARGGGSNPAYYWDEGIVPYAFDSDISQTNRNRVTSAMGIVQSHCSVLFVPRTNEPNWIQIGAHGGNWSYVGQIGGGQQISIYNWSYPYIIAHELSHALGRHHQMCRSDRNNYLTVNWNCIDDDCENNYQIAGTVNYEPYD
ncbi:MAG: M12 family metallopeptidase, partial [Phycisphaerales bacterium]|nr:M12 family metallopeptidase [Phycisphaerales bacterium]